MISGGQDIDLRTKMIKTDNFTFDVSFVMLSLNRIFIYYIYHRNALKTSFYKTGIKLFNQFHCQPKTDTKSFIHSFGDQTWQEYGLCLIGSLLPVI